MKRYLLSSICLVLLQYSFGADRYWIAPVTGNWNDITNWSTTSGGPGGASVPVAGDFVYFDANSLGDCNLNVDAAFDGINTTGYTGTIDLMGFAFDPVVTGAEDCRFIDGTIDDTPGTSSISYATTGITFFSNMTINADVDFSSDRIDLDGGTFNGSFAAEKTGAPNALGNGNCTYNGIANFVNSGSGYFLIAYTSPDVFNADVTFTNTGTSVMRVGQNAVGVTFNENIFVNSTAGNGVRFSDGTGTSILATGKTIEVGVDGFLTGELSLNAFTQLGATAQNIILTGDAILRIENNCVFNADFTGIAPRIICSTGTFNGTTVLEKTGSANDYCNGNNTFALDCSLINSGDGSLYFGNTNPDDFQGDLYFTNSGSANLYLAYSSAGNTVSGDLFMDFSGMANVAQLASVGGSSIDIAGNLTINSTSGNANSTIYIGNNGAVNIAGRFDANLDPTGNSASVIVGNGTTSMVTLNGTTHIINNGGLGLKRVFLGSSGDVTFNDSLIVENNADANNSQVYLNHSVNSSNAYNGHIVISNSMIDGDGFYFGNNGGTGVLAATREITIGAGGFVDGQLNFENFTQLSTTPQTLLLTGGRLYFENSEWEGEVDFAAPRVFIRESHFHDNAYIEKTGPTNDNSYGDNVFDGNTELKNSGFNNFAMGNNMPDIFNGNLILNNEGSGGIIIASNSPGNYIGGNVTINNLGTGAANCYVTLAESTNSELTIDGNVDCDNIGDANNVRFYFGSRGDITLNGDLNINHSPTGIDGYAYIANTADSEVIINGETTIMIGASGGTTKRTFVAQSGLLTLNGDLIIHNESDANNNEVYLHDNTSSFVNFNGNIELTSTNIDGDGFLFGTGGGSGELADTYTINIGLGGFISGSLYFHNFTQIGLTPQNLNITGSAYMQNQYSDWGASVNFVAPRFYTRNTYYRNDAYIEKTGPSNDNSYGGNHFEGITTLVNASIDDFYMGNAEADTFALDLFANITNEGTLIVAYNSPDNYFGGDIDASNNATGGANEYFSICYGGSSTAVVDGNISIVNTGAAPSSSIYLANSGVLEVNGNLTIDHSPVGDDGYLYIANAGASSFEINGDTEITMGTEGGTTKRTYISSSGSSIFNGQVEIINNSNANNNQCYISSNALANTDFNGNLILSSTHADGDGFLFGNSDGTTTLADSYTVSIGGGGFIAGDLYFRNFTQDGPTAQSITITGSAYFRNINADWGGNTTFIAPRFNTTDTRYRGESYIEKTGAIDDASTGGNIFEQDAILVNTGSDYLLMGNGDFDLWQGDLTMINDGEDNMYIAHNSAGNQIDGDLVLNCTSVGAYTQSNYISNATGSTLDILGNTTINNTANVTNSNIYFGENGTINNVGFLSIINNSLGTNADIRIANNTNSIVTVDGPTTVNNMTTGGNSKEIYLGYNGDIIFNGDLTLTNSSDATNSMISLNERGNSENNYNGDIELNCDNAGCEGVYFGRYGGMGTLADGFAVSIGALDFIGDNLLFRQFTQLGSTPQTLEPISGNTRFENDNSVWNGDVLFRSPRMFTEFTTYNSDAFIEKTGSANDNSSGGNIFNAETTLRNSGDGNFMPANANGNDFNGNVFYEDVSTGSIQPTYNSTSTYAGNISIDANETVTFGAGGNGRAMMDGTTAQAINVVGATPTPRFRDLQTDNLADEITLNTPIEIISELDLDNGNIISTAINIVNMTDNSIVSSVSDDAFVDGPVIKIGNDAFVFPVGKIGVYRPIEMVTGPPSGSAQFRAEYFPNDVVDDAIPDLPVEPAIHHISDCEYWLLDRLVTTNSVVVGLYYKDFSPDNCSGVEVQADLLVSRWSGSIWEDLGNGGTTGIPEDGWVRSLGPVTDFSPFTIATTTGLNPLPVELIEFSARKVDETTVLTWITESEINNDYFELQRSLDGIAYETISTIDGAGNSNQEIYYKHTDYNPAIGVNYYRLKQVDFDGSFEYSETKSVEFDGGDDILIYPNPLKKGNELIIQSNSPINFISILNEAGQIVYSIQPNGNQNQNKISLDHLEAGIYSVQLVSTNATKVKKLIVH